MQERDKIKLENRIRLQQALASNPSPRNVLPGRPYGITHGELQQITKPLALRIQRLLEEPIEG